MRKIFYVFLLILWVGNVWGQCNYSFGNTGDVWFFPASNDTLTLGDSTYINIKYTYTSTPGVDTFSIQIVNKTTFTNPIIYHNLSICDIMNLPQNVDGTTTIKFKIPTNINTGDSYLSTTVGPNGNGIPFYLKSNIVSGIKNPLTAPKNIKIYYYNLEGEEIEKPSQGFAIWRAETGESGKIYINN